MKSSLLDLDATETLRSRSIFHKEFALPSRIDEMMSKKNLRTIPKSVKARLERLGARYLVAACSRICTSDELAAGAFKHLGVTISGGKLVAPQALIPPAESGKYSDRNVNGYEVVRKDLPKETHYNSIDAPDWGDWSKGSHSVDLPYEKYPRDCIGPEFMQIKIGVQKLAGKSAGYMLMFEVDKVIDQKERDFTHKLLACLNLLQENVGTCGVQRSGVTVADYLKTTMVSWEILPPGTREEVVSRLFRSREPSVEEKAAVEDRYDFLVGLKPQNLIYGTSGFQRYFGGMIESDLVVFENIEYGNAIYIMFEDWKKLSRRSRTELLSGRYGSNFERVPHLSGWKGTVREIIKKCKEAAKK